MHLSYRYSSWASRSKHSSSTRGVLTGAHGPGKAGHAVNRITAEGWQAGIGMTGHPAPAMHGHHHAHGSHGHAQNHSHEAAHTQHLPRSSSLRATQHQDALAAGVSRASTIRSARSSNGAAPNDGPSVGRTASASLETAKVKVVLTTSGHNLAVCCRQPAQIFFVHASSIGAHRANALRLPLQTALAPCNLTRCSFTLLRSGARLDSPHH